MGAWWWFESGSLDVLGRCVSLSGQDVRPK
jgi:hypothetical protein